MGGKGGEADDRRRSVRRNTNQLRQGFATRVGPPHLASASRSWAEKQIWMGGASLPRAITTAGLDGHRHDYDRYERHGQPSEPFVARAARHEK